MKEILFLIILCSTQNNMADEIKLNTNTNHVEEDNLNQEEINKNEYYEMINTNRFVISDNILAKSMFIMDEDEFNIGINKNENLFDNRKSNNDMEYDNEINHNICGDRMHKERNRIDEIIKPNNADAEDDLVIVKPDDNIRDEMDDVLNKILELDEDEQDGMKENQEEDFSNYYTNSDLINHQKKIEENYAKIFKPIKMDELNDLSEAFEYSNQYYNEYIKHQTEMHEKIRHGDNLNAKEPAEKSKFNNRDNTNGSADNYFSVRSESGPLFLTPYIYSQNSEIAQKLSYVKPFVGDIKSYSGYLTVDTRYHSNLFFWFFPCELGDYKTKPVVLWLQGGPGSSSLFGLFYENGPYKIIDNKMYKNEMTWSKHYNVLYIDNPVGTGFSFTTEFGYTKNQTIVSQHLYEALKQFFYLFPELLLNNFYISGESYAGKYIPSLAYEIHNRNLLSHFKINLKALFIGNGLIDPISMLEYNEFLYQLGLLDQNQKEIFKKYEQNVEIFIKNKHWKKASLLFSSLFFNGFTKGNALITKLTGFTQIYNLKGLDFSTKGFDNFLQDDYIRNSIHVGHMKYNDGSLVFNYLLKDIMKSVLYKINILVENYVVVLFYGQLDIICPYRLSLKVFENIEYSNAFEYYKSKRNIWTYERNDDQDNVIGYSKQGGKLVEVLVRNAGHMSPRDQPRFIIDLLNKYIE